MIQYSCFMIIIFMIKELSVILSGFVILFFYCCILIVFLLQESLMMVTEVSETCC